MNSVDRFLRVLRQEPVDRPPVVGVTSVVTVELMRMMGTCWPDAHHDPEQMVRAGAAAHEICGLESVKLPFDMCVEASAFGAEVDYGSGATLPRLSRQPFAHPEEFAAPEDFVSRGRVPVVLEAIRIARRRYGERAPVIASVLGPLTVSGCLFGIETLLLWMLDEPEQLRTVLETAARMVRGYVCEQFKAGAHVVQVGEAAASGDLISPAQYAAHVEPHHRALCRDIEQPLITHICGDITRQLPHLADVGFRGISFDVKTEIEAARKHLKGRRALIGYVPTSLLLQGSPREVGDFVRQCVREGVDAINAGCAVPAETALATIRAMVEAGTGGA